MTITTVTGALPDSTRRYRIAVADRALGVWVAPRVEGGDPFVALVANPARTLEQARDLADVADYIVHGAA